MGIGIYNGSSVEVSLEPFCSECGYHFRDGLESEVDYEIPYNTRVKYELHVLHPTKCGKCYKHIRRVLLKKQYMLRTEDHVIDYSFSDTHDQDKCIDIIMKPVCKCGNVIEDLNVGEDDNGNIMFSPIFCPRCEGRITTLVLKGLNYNLCVGGSHNEL